MRTLSTIREERAAKTAEARAIVAAAETAKRQLTEAETAAFEKIRSDILALEAEESRAAFLADAQRRSAGVVIAPGGGDTFAALQAQVRVLDVLRAGMEGRALTGAAAEYHLEAERRAGRKALGILIPMAALETRVNTTTSATELVSTDHRADQYIQPLRNRLMARRLGARVLSGLSGNVVIPKHGTGVTTGWVAENSALPESDVNPDSLTLTPKHCGGVTELSRQLILQGSPDVEQLVRDDFAAMLAQAIDAAMIAGTGASNQPRGILSTPGIQTSNLLTLSWANVVAMKSKLATANAEGRAWLMNARVAAKFESTEKAAGTGIFLLGDDGRIASIGANVTEQVPNVDVDSGYAILGDFSQVLLGIWSEVDLLVNPFAETAYRRGGVLVRAMATVDVAIRHPQAFVVANDVVI
jgi:HK97 family phage major capsid protein